MLKHSFVIFICTDTDVLGDLNSPSTGSKHYPIFEIGQSANLTTQPNFNTALLGVKIFPKTWCSVWQTWPLFHSHAHSLWRIIMFHATIKPHYAVVSTILAKTNLKYERNNKYKTWQQLKFYTADREEHYNWFSFSTVYFSTYCIIDSSVELKESSVLWVLTFEHGDDIMVAALTIPKNESEIAPDVFIFLVRSAQ